MNTHMLYLMRYEHLFIQSPEIPQQTTIVLLYIMLVREDQLKHGAIPM